MATNNLDNKIESNQVPKAYDPLLVEDKWYSYWLEKKIFHSEIDEEKEPYVIPIPPPNVTGMLTMGHILNNTIQDIFIRTKRMQGFNACWVPGTDHASIATETKVTNYLQEQGINKFEIGRDEFLKHCWEWTEKYGGIIIQQLKKLGVSCDWERERFTMDDDYYEEVIKAFVNLYKEGNIYRGYRMVNWCPASKSAISDEEVNYKNVNGKLWHFRYPVKDSSEFVVVATTRPETMLGDTGVAVNPNDERYKDLIGKKILLPIAEREIPIFADEYVDMEFGTGAVKVTPAHDVNDYDMGKRHDLQFINIFNDDASTNNNVPKEFQNLDRNDARKKVVQRFEESGLLEKTEDYQHKVGYSERGGVPIEPYLSEQWFMKMNELAKPAIDVVKDGKINFYPDHWKKTYFHWMENINDWCISRQLWWGHRIPVWYHKKSGEVYCDIKPPENFEDWKQDEDVLDTWASSWLWAHAIFRTEEEQNYYYPTNTLVTAPDIIFFWVARMIMAGTHFKKDIPFTDVYFTSVIRDVQGRKMSKSLGNSPDPLDVIKEYGADALRFTVIYLAPLGQDVLFSTDKCEIGRNFANKIWNAGRFLMMNKDQLQNDSNKFISEENIHTKHVDFADEWIISRFNKTLTQLNKAMDQFEVNNASKIIYSFIWNDYCDWYLELIKNRLYSDDEEIKAAVLSRAIKLFEDMMKILHPFMPFITEELWQLLEKRNDGESISISEYPKVDKSLLNEKAEDEMSFVQDVITAIRNIRGEMNIPPSKKVDALMNNVDTVLFFDECALMIEVKNKYHKISRTNFKNLDLSERYKRRLLKIEAVVEKDNLAIKSANKHLLIAFVKEGIGLLHEWNYQHKLKIIREEMQEYIKKLAKLDKLIIDFKISRPQSSITTFVQSCEIYIPLEGLIDLDIEKERLQKEITRLGNSLAGIEKKLSNEKFVNNAPADVVEKERKKKSDWTENLEKVKAILEDLN